MAGNKEPLNEFKADDKQSVIPEPIGKDAHANRSADKADNGQKAPLQFLTKVDAINAFVSALLPFETQEISDMLAGIGPRQAGKANRPLDKSGKLDGTVAWKGVTKEDIDALFAGSELNEEQTAQAVTLFEAAVELKAQIVEAGLNEKFETNLTEAVTEIREDITKSNDQYLDYVAGKWMEENAVAVESSLKVTMAENFITKLTGLLAEHSIILPESVDVVEDLTSRLEEADKKLAEAISKIEEQADQILGYQMNEKFAEVTEGLALTQVEKLRTLAENVEANTVAEFETKLGILKSALLENAGTSASKRGESSLNEEVVLNEDDAKPAPATPAVRSYADAITRHVKS